MQKSFARTDLAAEANSRLDKQYKGVVSEELTISNCKASRVSVTDDEAARALGKPIGDYFTLEMEKYVSRTENSFSDCANALALLLNKFSFIQNAKSVLVACLGNRAVTPDAIGPDTADSLIVTRHLKSSLPEQFNAFSSVCVFRTGVLGTTGIESADGLKAICDFVKPDCVIAVDALASGELDRLCKNVQICNTGISPGSGVGNNRAALNYDFLGVPVAAIGVPTVIDAAAFTEAEEAKGLFVTPRNIDELVRSSAKLIAYGINLAVHKGLTIEDIDMLVE